MADKYSATHGNKNPLIRLFFKLKTSIAINLANLKEGDHILDFGCGAGYLKNKLKGKGHNAQGYDITPHQSDVGDYTTLKPNKIFVLDVFEHIPLEEIKNIIQNFKNMNSRFELITIIPTENWISRKSRKLLGKSEKVEGHITSLKDILRVLKKELRLVKKINFLSISYIAKFKNI